jgi:hypothetical protein
MSVFLKNIAKKSGGGLKRKTKEKTNLKLLKNIIYN